MSCSHPLLAVDLRKSKDYKSDVKKIKVLTRIDEINSIDAALERYQRFGDKLMLLPCGRCPACLLKYRKAWAVRCEMESKFHQENCFVTLTYDDDHLPEKLVRKHFTDFIKALRNYGLKIRYFGCGEYGSLTHRPHGHIILFGYFPTDAVPFGKSQSGFQQYTSKILDVAWKHKGLVTVSEFAPETAGYVAGYVNKKLDDHFDEDFPTFIFMSTHPGIGRQYVENNLGKIYRNDQLVVSFGSHRFGVPRYFDKVAEDLGLYIDDIKEVRLRSSNISTYTELRDHGFTNLEDLFDYQNNISAERLKRKVRGL